MGMSANKKNVRAHKRIDWRGLWKKFNARVPDDEGYFVSWEKQKHIIQRLVEAELKRPRRKK